MGIGVRLNEMQAFLSWERLRMKAAISDFRDGAPRKGEATI